MDPREIQSEMLKGRCGDDGEFCGQDGCKTCAEEAKCQEMPRCPVDGDIIDPDGDCFHTMDSDAAPEIFNDEE